MKSSAKTEFHAEYALALTGDTAQGPAINWLVGKTRRVPDKWTQIAQIEDEPQRMTVLAQSAVTGKASEAKAGTRRELGGYIYWLKYQAARVLQSRHRHMEKLGLTTFQPDLRELPTGSWYINFTFVLRKPYISRDDRLFHILDNPVKKEWIFGVPYVAPSQWKGALRNALVQDLVSQAGDGQVTSERFLEERIRLAFLFGAERNLDNDETELLLDTVFRKTNEQYRGQLRTLLKLDEENTISHRGCLHFYPTYFDQVGLEVISPHDRKKGVVGLRGPIYVECVPPGSKGEFALLYVPRTRADDNSTGSSKGALDDLAVVARGIYLMMTRYGFGAKTSIGYGVTESRLAQGKLTAMAGDKLCSTEIKTFDDILGSMQRILQDVGGP